MKSIEHTEGEQIFLPFGLSHSEPESLVVVPNSGYEAAIEFKKIELDPNGWSDFTYSVCIRSTEEPTFEEDLGSFTIEPEIEDRVINFKVEEGELTPEELVKSCASQTLVECTEKIQTYERRIKSLKRRIAGLIGAAATSGVVTSGLLIASRTNNEIADRLPYTPFVLFSIVSFLGSSAILSDKLDDRRQSRDRLSVAKSSKEHIQQFMDKAQEQGLVHTPAQK